MLSLSVEVCVPCLNEAATIGRVVADLRAALPDHAIVVYDNGSTDDTATIARDAGADVQSVPERGKGRVMQHAIHTTDADVLLFIDGDATYPADRAVELLGPMNDGADMVIANRLHAPKPRSLPGLRSVGNYLLAHGAASYWCLPGLDVLSGFRAVRVDTARSLGLSEPGFGIETELTFAMLQRGHRVETMPIDYLPRPDGSDSKLTVGRDGLAILRAILRYSR